MIERPCSRLLGGWLAVFLGALVFTGGAAAAPGDLDSRFGDSGLVVINFGAGASDFAEAVAMMPDGRIVAAGRTGNNFAVARRLPDGGRDITFGGGDGLAEAGFGAPDEGHDVAVDADGRIIVVGETQSGPNPPSFGLVRFDFDGNLDAAFSDGISGDGKVRTDFGDEDRAHGVAIAPDGKIVAAGGSGGPGGDFAVARYDDSGAPDADFAGIGRLTTAFGVGSTDTANAVAVAADGRIVAAGLHYNGVLPYFALARYEEDGTLDGTFGDGGLVRHYFDGVFDHVADVALTADGGILAAGTANNRFALARYTEDGSLDPSFGAGGEVTIDTEVAIVGHGVAIAPDGRIVIAGRTLGPGDLAVARLNPNGSPDARFGTDGVVVSDFGGSEGAEDVALTPDGAIIVTGWTDRGPDPPNFLLARYSDRLRIVRLIRKPRRGIARAVVEAPGPGRIALRRTKKLRGSAAEREAAGRLRLRVTPRGKAKRRLSKRRCATSGKRRLRVRVRATLAYQPPAGLPDRTQRRLRLVRRC